MLIDDCKVTVEAPTIAGTTTIDSAAYDTSGYDETLFIVRLGTPAANNNIRVQQDTVTGMGTAADLTGTLVGSATLNQHMVNVRRPVEQFVRVRVTRGTSTTIDTITVIQSGPRTRPVTQPATSISEKWISPAEGTA
jgi:hypothetical protein